MQIVQTENIHKVKRFVRTSAAHLARQWTEGLALWSSLIDLRTPACPLLTPDVIPVYVILLCLLPGFILKEHHVDLHEFLICRKLPLHGVVELHLSVWRSSFSSALVHILMFSDAKKSTCSGSSGKFRSAPSLQNSTALTSQGRAASCEVSQWPSSWTILSFLMVAYHFFPFYRTL